MSARTEGKRRRWQQRWREEGRHGRKMEAEERSSSKMEERVRNGSKMAKRGVRKRVWKTWSEVQEHTRNPRGEISKSKRVGMQEGHL